MVFSEFLVTKSILFFGIVGLASLLFVVGLAGLEGVTEVFEQFARTVTAFEETVPSFKLNLQFLEPFVCVILYCEP